jgi:hypothetical protein
MFVYLMAFTFYHIEEAFFISQLLAEMFLFIRQKNLSNWLTNPLEMALQQKILCKKECSKHGMSNVAIDSKGIEFFCNACICVS